jgi:cytochrome oxidase Cu insertion factor (SCO1/SenC/PrrC family)
MSVHRGWFIMVRRLALIVVLLLATLSIVWSALAAPRVLPRLRLAPGFGLEDPSGKLVSSDSLRGQILVVTFGSAECGTDCASRGQLLATAAAGTETTGRVELIWIASEPASREQLAALSETLAQHGHPWRVLGSSDRRELDLTLSGFRVPRHPDGTVDPDHRHRRSARDRPCRVPDRPVTRNADPRSRGTRAGNPREPRCAALSLRGGTPVHVQRRRSMTVSTRTWLRRLVVAELAAIAIVLAVVGWYVWQSRSAPSLNGALLDPPQEIPTIQLTGSDGQPHALTEFRGKVTVVFFGYSHCPDVCPTTALDDGSGTRHARQPDRSRAARLRLGRPGTRFP